MSALEKYMQDKGISPSEKTKPAKAFTTMSTAEKWALIEVLLRDLGYID